MTKRSFAIDSLIIDVRTVEAAQIAEPVPVRSQLDDAVLLGHDAIEKLHRVVRMTPERVDRAKLDRCMTLRGGKDESRH